MKNATRERPRGRGLLVLGLTFSLAACATAAPVPRAPARLDFVESPNGLWWDAATRTLLIADDAGPQILAWQEGGKPKPAGAIPGDPGAGLGQVLRLEGGTLVVARLGHGVNGAVWTVDARGEAKSVPGLDATRHRIGIAPAPDGGIFVGIFGKNGERKVGGLAEVTLAGGERDLVTGLDKPVGLAVTGDQLYVSDQGANAILRCPARGCTQLERVLATPAPDLLAPGPGGSVLATSKNGGVLVLCADGQPRQLVTGTVSTRGVAYDPERHRLFYVEHDGKTRTSSLVLLEGVDVERTCNEPSRR